MAELVKLDTLDAFLAENVLRSWDPGGSVDCCLALAEWAIWLGYDDPAAHLRGIYGAGQGQIDMLSQGGGAMGLIERCALSIGAVRTFNPSRGDIGVVGSPTVLTRQFGVIHDGRGWITRTKTEFTRVTARTLAAWKI